MEALGRLLIWIDSISHAIPEQLYIVVMDHLKAIHDEIENKDKPEDNRCRATKRNGSRCRQEGKPNQSGGQIIDGYCSYHANQRRR